MSQGTFPEYQQNQLKLKMWAEKYCLTIQWESHSPYIVCYKIFNLVLLIPILCLKHYKTGSLFISLLTFIHDKIQTILEFVLNRAFYLSFQLLKYAFETFKANSNNINDEQFRKWMQRKLLVFLWILFRDNNLKICLIYG